MSSPDAWAPAMILRKAARLVSRPIELSAPATSGAWVTSEIASRNTAMTVGSLTSRTSFVPKEASACARVSRLRSTGWSAGASRDFAGVRSLGDAEQQVDHQIAPE